MPFCPAMTLGLVYIEAGGTAHPFSPTAPSLHPSDFSGAMRSRTRCLSSLDSGKAAFDGALEHGFAVDADDEHAAAAGFEGDFADFLLEGEQQFLGEPAGAQDEAALGAVFDFDAGFGHGVLQGNRRTAAYPVKRAGARMGTEWTAALLKSAD